MSKISVRIVAGMLVFAALAYASGEDKWTFRGEIADSQCALNVHSLTRSHQEMLKSKSMGGTSLSCILYCIKYLGGDLVLTSRKHVYHLDNQDRLQKFIAQKVKIQGTLDQKTDTIHVEKIEVDD
jgi:type 1 fimbria pilin